ncbi:G-protein coupled receptor 35-like [Carettochelys insculpta]|uniref:G-protein coupled receptor 35-like n=1 Tax=Carettochelys insculpta TaxID=44489 RepID=UPI003EB9CA50
MDCSNISFTNQSYLNLFQLTVYIPVFFLGVIFNVIAFWVFCHKLKKWTETRVYMINLVIADCFLLFTLPFIIYFHNTSYPTNKLCYVIQTIYFTNMPVSIYIITLIAVDRFVAIKYPLKAKSFRSPLKAAVICGFLWITIIIYASLNPRFSEKEKVCFRKRSAEPLTTSLLSTIWGFFIPLVILSFCSIQVIWCLKKKKDTSSHEETSIRKALWIVSMNLCVFITCFLPFNLGLLIRYAVDVVGAACSVRQNASSFIRVAACIANSNCCLDALCYYFVAKEFQEASSELPPFKAMKSRSNQSKESQLQTHTSSQNNV